MRSPPRTDFAALLRRASEVDAETFAQEFSAPYLVATGTLAGSLDPGKKTQDTGLLRVPTEGPAHTLGVKNPLAGHVFAVRKTIRDDPTRIYVGRADANDVVIVDRSISARQAWFERQGEAMVVVDAHSRNGTFVNLEQLAKGAAHAVREEDVVTFGRVSFQFFSPAGLYYALRIFSQK
jgi:hypothetical protein